MSVINQMLNDLDARKAAERPALPSEIRPLPRAAKDHRRRYLAAGSTLLAVFGAAFWWRLMMQRVEPPPPVIAAALPAPGLPPVSVPAPDDMAGAIDAIASRAASPAMPGVPAADPAPALRISARLSSVREEEPAPARLVAASVTPRPAVVAAPSARPPVAEAPAPAVEIAKQSHDSSPRDKAERLYRSAVVTLNQGGPAEAIEVLQAALREDPTHFAARQVLIKMLVDARAWDGARAVLQEGIESVPQQWSWALLLSRLQIDRGDAEGALKTLERSEGAAAASADYQGAMGAVLHRLGRYPEAEARYAAAARIEPAGGRWWFGRGMALDGLGKPHEARESYLRAKASGTLSAELAALVDQKLK